ncbi:MAG: TatD family hydrolase [Planctomycetota bacterium]|jgi:TatD DNase family protein|nr:TatD family hydrolase [Planctomycetota bacterium]
MTANYVDTHCHLASNRFDADRDQVARECIASGVRMIEAAGTVENSRIAVRLARRYPEIRASAGVHPTDTAALGEADWEEIVGLADDESVAAIGETGLDYHWKDSPPEVQKTWFLRHIELAKAVDKPVVVHARDSVPDVLSMLEPHFKEGLKAVWHCFAAPKRDLDDALEFAVRNALFLGIGGLATFEDQKALRSRLARIPDRLLLLETDSPYLIPRPRESDRNDPRGVIRVAEALAELRGATREEIARITTENAIRLFRLG